MISEGLVSAAKLTGSFLVSSGVSTMVGYAAKSSVPKIAPFYIRHIPVAVKTWKVFHKVAIPAGAAALAGMASEHAVKYSDKKIDETVRDINKLQQDIKAYEAKLAEKKASKEESSESD